MTSLEQRWVGFFANPNYIRNGNVVTWPNRIRTDVDTTPDLLVTLIEKRQYSIQVLEDGSVFQLYYAFEQNGNRLVEASLGFHHAGEIVEDSGDPSVDGVVPLAASGSPGGWIRLDYDPSAARDCLHYHAHLHMSISSNIRVAVKRVPTPKQFIELVLSWFYPEVYRADRLPNNIFQLSEDDVRDLFDEVFATREVAQDLHGIHIFIP